MKELSIELTHRCSLHCVYCSSDASIDKFDSIELAIELERLKEIVLEAKYKFGVQDISLSGGETFLYPHFNDLYRFLVNKGFTVLIYTSGVVLDKDGRRIPLSIRFLQELRVTEDNPQLIFNIQGHNRELVESINGVPGTYELIEESIDNIESEDIYLGAHVVPFKMNFQFLRQIFDYCFNKSFNEIAFLRYVPQGRGIHSNLCNTKDEFRKINEDLASILTLEQSKTEVRLGHPINFLHLIDCEELYNKEETHYCRGGLDAPLILPDGYVSMCPAWKNLSEYHAGNIYNQDFEEIWMSHYFNVFRDFVNHRYRELQEPCRSCGHLEICRGKCVAQRLLIQRERGEDITLEERLLLAPDPLCFKEVVNG